MELFFTMCTPTATIGEAPNLTRMKGDKLPQTYLSFGKHYKDIIQSKVMTESITLEALIDSIEILNNPKTMELLRRSDLDIKEGRVKEVFSIEGLLSEL